VKNILLLVLLVSLGPVSFSAGTGGLTGGTGSPGKIEMLDFNEFEPWLYKETDSVYVINFWATWCAPCVREIPAFEEIHEKYGPEKVKVVLVSLDFPNQVDSRVLPFMERMNIQSKVILLDDPFSNRWIGRVSEEWSGAIPATVIYSKDYRGFYEREFKFEELEDIIKPLIQ
jgi:thiol-disulfide isomerase/thioredoxin